MRYSSQYVALPARSLIAFNPRPRFSYGASRTLRVPRHGRGAVQPPQPGLVVRSCSDRPAVAHRVDLVAVLDDPAPRATTSPTAGPGRGTAATRRAAGRGCGPARGPRRLRLVLPKSQTCWPGTVARPRTPPALHGMIEDEALEARQLVARVAAPRRAPGSSPLNAPLRQPSGRRDAEPGSHDPGHRVPPAGHLPEPARAGRRAPCSSSSSPCVGLAGWRAPQNARSTSDLRRPAHGRSSAQRRRVTDGRGDADRGDTQRVLVQRGAGYLTCGASSRGRLGHSVEPPASRRRRERRSGSSLPVGGVDGHVFERPGHGDRPRLEGRSPIARPRRPRTGGQETPTAVTANEPISTAVSAERTFTCDLPSPSP